MKKQSGQTKSGRTAGRSRGSKSKHKGQRSLWQAFAASMGGRLFFALLGGTLVVLFDILVSGNQFSTFFLWLGAELLIAFVVILLILAWQQRDVDRGRGGAKTK